MGVAFRYEDDGTVFIFHARRGKSRDDAHE